MENTAGKEKTKSPIWTYFTAHGVDVKLAVFNMCKESKSLGSVDPRKRTLVNLKDHIKAKHPVEWQVLNKELQSRSDKRLNDESIDVHQIKSKRQRTSLFQSTIPNFVETSRAWDIRSEKALKVRRSIFEFMMLDLQPYSIVNDPGLSECSR